MGFVLFNLLVVARMKRKLSRTKEPAHPSRHDALNRALGHYPGLHPPKLLASTLVSQPIVQVHGETCIYVPSFEGRSLSAKQKELILAHELAHLHRGDRWGQKLLTSVESLLFFQPVAWWVIRRFRWERELHCDEIVAKRTGEVHGYAEALVELDTLRGPSPVAVLGGGGSLKERISCLQRSIESPPPSRRAPRFVALVFGLLLVLAGGLVAQLPDTNATDRKNQVDYQEAWAEFQREMTSALNQQDPRAIMSLLDPFPNIDSKNFDMELMERLKSYLHSRYDEVFQAPANADSLGGPFGWSGAFFLSMYSKEDVTYIGTIGDRFYPHVNDYNDVPIESRHLEYETDHWFVCIDEEQNPFLQIDIEPDGVVDMSFDGEEVSAGSGGTGEIWVIEHDESQDLTRKQWLMGPAGSDVRKAPRIWIYKDGPIFSILMDTDGDGRGDLGRGENIP